MMKQLILNITLTLLISLSTCSAIYAQAVVSQAEMERVYNEVKTPYKYGLVLTAPTAAKMVDSPSIFRKGNTWYMYYIIFDGRGYETMMATSKDLLNWETKGRAMSFSDKTDWDSNQKAGYLALIDTKWGGRSALKKFNNHYWMSYLGGNSTGYEAGKLSTGIAYSDTPTQATEWHRIATPVLSPTDKDAQSWENRKIYKSIIIEDIKKLTGHKFVMYYNAKGKAESIGMAVSDDMLHWKRLNSKPVLDHKRGITGDAYLQRIGKLWVMFYFGFNWNKATSKRAWDTFACSYDLVNWTDWQGKPLVEPSEDFDARYAHKPWVIKYKGVVYHFYCAVDKKGRRGIAVATSKDLGKSNVKYPTHEGTTTR